MNAAAPDGAAPISVASFLELDPTERDLHLARCESAEAELLRLGDDAERSAASDPAAAAAWLAGLRAICGSVHPAARARAARGEVLALAYLGRLDEAIALAAAARIEAAEGGATVEAARLRLAAMQPLLKRGRIDEAIGEGESAAAELRAVDEATIAARAEINLGNVYKATGRPAQALVHLDRALEALGQEAALAAAIENTRGEALLQMDRFDEARAAFVRAIEHFTAQAQGFAWAIAEGNLADLAARSGQLAESFERFASARARLPASAVGHAARLLLEEGEVFQASGLLEVALDRLLEADRALDNLGLVFEAERAALAVARTRVALGRDEEAVAGLAARAPLEARDPLGLLRRQSIAALAEAGAAARSLGGGSAEATSSVERLAATIAEVPASLDRVLALDLLAAANERLGRLDQALAAARSASEEGGAMGLDAVMGEVDATRARLARRSSLGPEALAAARRAVAATERTRASFGADRLRSAFLGSHLAAYEELVLALVEQGGPAAIEEAFEIAELARSRTLLERLFGSLPRTEEAPDPETQRLLDRLKGLHARLAAVARDDARSMVIDPIRLELAEADAALERRLSERAGLGAVRGSTANATTPRGSWRRHLAEGQAIVEYFEAAGRLLAFVARRDGVAVVELPVAIAAIEDTVGKFHFRIRRRLRSPGSNSPADDVSSLLGRLGGWLWQPVLPSLAGCTSLLVAPHGCMHSVPLAAVIAACGDDAPVLATVPTAAAWARLASGSATRQEDGAMLLVGVADTAAPRINEEIDRVEAAVAGMRPVRTLRGSDATAAAVLEQLEDPSVTVAHLACHGQFLPEAPQASGIRAADRWISVRELTALSRTPETVILSGCDTGSVAVSPGEETLGLPRAFLAGGTRRLIGSLWSVGDRDTCELMVEFHRRWSRVGVPDRPSVAAALAQARLERSRHEPHPAHWASFVAVGDAL